MMSQAEIWEVKKYCDDRNSRRCVRRAYNIWNILFMIAGVILMTLSACLLVYVVKVGVDMTGMLFCGAGVAGILLGAVVFYLSRLEL